MTPEELFTPSNLFIYVKGNDPIWSQCLKNGINRMTSNSGWVLYRMLNMSFSFRSSRLLKYHCNEYLIHRKMLIRYPTELSLHFTSVLSSFFPSSASLSFEKEERGREKKSGFIWMQNRKDKSTGNGYKRCCFSNEWKVDLSMKSALKLFDK